MYLLTRKQYLAISHYSDLSLQDSERLKETSVGLLKHLTENKIAKTKTKTKTKTEQNIMLRQISSYEVVDDMCCDASQTFIFPTLRRRQVSILPILTAPEEGWFDQPKYSALLKPIILSTHAKSLFA